MNKPFLLTLLLSIFLISCNEEEEEVLSTQEQQNQTVANALVDYPVSIEETATNDAFAGGVWGPNRGTLTTSFRNESLISFESVFPNPNQGGNSSLSFEFEAKEIINGLIFGDVRENRIMMDDQSQVVRLNPAYTAQHNGTLYQGMINTVSGEFFLSVTVNYNFIDSQGNEFMSSLIIESLE